MQRLDEAKRTAILQAAKQRLSQYGVRKTTMQEIAEDAGIAVGTLYLYFKNKNEILIATAEAYTQQHIADSEKILRDPIPAPEKLKAYLINRFRAVRENRLSGSHAAELARAVIRLKPELQEKQGKAVKDNLSSILQEGVRANLFRIDRPEQDLEVFLYSIGYFFPLPTSEKYYEPSEEKLLLVVDWFIKQWSRK
ncbi:MAG: TetR/AcrR family transcriptional regulator [Oscillatoriaceae cyanobacterium Prado104]|jgi:AcrR family transcriptional regulator|nr:TetR/AcrR family transcriptional regulator [Oscillatoriaceae cyanobacterium Prado104]